jgi:hypothetical protein
MSSFGCNSFVRRLLLAQATHLEPRSDFAASQIQFGFGYNAAASTRQDYEIHIETFYSYTCGSEVFLPTLPHEHREA